MKIKLNDILDQVSEKTGIERKNISVLACFDEVDIDVGKDCSEWREKRLCVDEYDSYVLMKGLYVRVLANGYEVLGFNANDIRPDTNDIYDLMRVSHNCHCVGPGFYSYCPYLILDGKCDPNNIKKFVDLIEINPEKTDIKFTAKNKSMASSKEQLAFLKTLPKDAITMSFFKNFEDCSGSERF